MPACLPARPHSCATRATHSPIASQGYYNKSHDFAMNPDLFREHMARHAKQDLEARYDEYRQKTLAASLHVTQDRWPANLVRLLHPALAAGASHGGEDFVWATLYYCLRCNQLEEARHIAESLPHFSKASFLPLLSSLSKYHLMICACIANS
jgi:hypothetical protein